MSKEADKEEIKQCLKDANMYEDDMSDDLMSHYYRTIKDSEYSLIEDSKKHKLQEEESQKSLNESAIELLEAIYNSESIAPSNRNSETFTITGSDDEEPSTSFKDNLLPHSRIMKSIRSKDEEEDNNNNIEEDSEKLIDNSKDCVLDVDIAAPIGFNDMPESNNMEKGRLKIINHNLKYVNIQNSEKFLNATSKIRIKMLYDYHLAASSHASHLASLSSNMAPLGKPINLIDQNFVENPTVAALRDEKMEFQDTYVSRSGRHTKRKVYFENDDSSQDSFTINNKKTKTDETWLCKTITKAKNPKKNENGPDNTYVSNDTVDDFDALKEDKNTTLPPKPRTYQRKMTNEEIMGKSTLFRDSNTPKKGRTEAILDAAKEEIKRIKKQEEVMEKFTSSLDSDSQSIEGDFEKTVNIDDDSEPLERRRVVPTCPVARKPIHKRRGGSNVGFEPLPITTKKAHLTSETVTSSEAVNINKRHTVPAKKPNIAENRNEPSASEIARTSKQANLIPCPLCSMSFPQKEIEEHASTCGEDMFTQVAPTKLSRISCDICDQLIPLTTDYEIHVKACRAKKNGLQ